MFRLAVVHFKTMETLVLSNIEVKSMDPDNRLLFVAPHGCLWVGERPILSQLAMLCYLLNPLFYECARLHIRAFCGKSFFILSGDPTVWGAISH